ncbi:hypothetical protein VTN96DRAFT_470 [Rasamsonia emersonii]
MTAMLLQGCAGGEGRNETSQSDLLSPIRHLLSYRVHPQPRLHAVTVLQFLAWTPAAPSARDDFLALCPVPYLFFFLICYSRLSLRESPNRRRLEACRVAFNGSARHRHTLFWFATDISYVFLRSCICASPKKSLLAFCRLAPIDIYTPSYPSSVWTRVCAV